VNTFLKDPARVEVAPPATAAKTITQLFRFCPATEDWEKREALRELIRTENVKNAIIFCNRKRDVAILLKSLQKHGFNAGALHGDMDQMSLMATLDAFREGRITLLAASDVAARGLDIPDVSHIFNFDVPWQADDYVHRIGRTGRAGKEGRSLTIVTVDDIRQLKDIEKMLGAPVTWIGAAPSEADIAEGSRKRRGRGGPKRAADGRRPAPGRDAGRDARRGREAEPRSAPRRARRAERAPQPNGNGAHHEAGANGTHPTRPRSEAPARQPAQPAPPRQAAPAKPPRPKRERKPPRQPWEPREPRREREDRVPTPVGLGDHVPAFLRKPVR
jgi:superfamily II DNA/RNA helicase